MTGPPPGESDGCVFALAGLQEELAEAAKCDEVTIWRWETGQPCDRRLWSRGVGCLQDRLQSIGLAGLTSAGIETLKAVCDYATGHR